MSRQPKSVREKVAAHRARQKAAGLRVVNSYLPGELVEAIDRIKQERGLPGRDAVVEEALRAFVEQAKAGGEGRERKAARSGQQIGTIGV